MAGPFYFAYANWGDAFDPAVHNREDEAITALSLTQTEGDFAGLTITVVNPGGLLVPGRMLWAWLSWDDGTAIVPLFYGRIVAVPEQIDGETVRLLFSARPLDFDDIKAAHAETLRVLPYWDTVWIMGDLSDPDAVLTTRGAAWHIDRTTLALTTSDQLTGEDGTLSIGEADHLYANFEMSYTRPPLSQVDLTGTLSWTQSGTGTIDVSGMIYKGFSDSFTPYAWTESGVIATLTGDGLSKAWPKPGTSLGGGWTVSNDTRIENAPDSFERFSYGLNFLSEAPPGNAPETADPATTAGNWMFGYQDYNITYEVSAFVQQTKFDWLAAKKRTEIFTAVLVANIQPLLAEPGNQENIGVINISAQDTVTEPDSSGAPPVGDARRKSYLNSDRGTYSVQHLLLLARAQLRIGARAIEVRCRVPWATGIAATLRKNAQIVDYRLPGGEAFGKIVDYEFAAAGTGEFYVDITAACTIGLGGTVSAAAGTPTWADIGYVADGYQQLSGAEITAPTGDLVYQSLDDFTVDDDGVDLLTLDIRSAVQSLQVHNSLGEQIDFANQDISASFPKTAPTQICVQLVPVADLEFSTTYAPAVQTIPIPKTIDLQAVT